MAKKRKGKNGSWIVTMSVTVTRECIFDNCTEEEAERPDWLKCVSERDLEMTDWEVLNVEPNE